jgi:hypothetical protein
MIGLLFASFFVLTYALMASEKFLFVYRSGFFTTEVIHTMLLSVIAIGTISIPIYMYLRDKKHESVMRRTYRNLAISGFTIFSLLPMINVFGKFFSYFDKPKSNSKLESRSISTSTTESKSQQPISESLVPGRNSELEISNDNLDKIMSEIRELTSSIFNEEVYPVSLYSDLKKLDEIFKQKDVTGILSFLVELKSRPLNKDQLKEITLIIVKIGLIIFNASHKTNLKVMPTPSSEVKNGSEQVNPENCSPTKNPNVETTLQQEPKNQNNDIVSLISVIREIIKPIVNEKECEFSITDLEELLGSKDIGRITLKLFDLKLKPIADQMIQSIDSALTQIRIFLNSKKN